MTVRAPNHWILASAAVLILAASSFHSLAYGPATLTLAWDPSSDPSAMGYRLYEGNASETFTNVVDIGSNLQAEVSGLIPGATYFFAVTAYDETGLESEFSGQISYTAPTSVPRPLPARLVIAQNEFNQAVLTGTGPAGDVYDVCASLDLVSWLVIGNVSVDAAGLFQFVDPPSFALPRRFYRLRQHP